MANVDKRIILDLVASVNNCNMTMTAIANQLNLDMAEVKSWLKLEKEPPKDVVKRISDFIKNPDAAKTSEAPKTEQKVQQVENKLPDTSNKEEPFMPEPEPVVVVEKESEKESKQESTKTTKNPETTKTTKTSKKEEPVMPTKEKKSTNKPVSKQKNEEKKFFRESTEVLIRNEINAKKTDVLTTDSVSLAGKNIADRIMKSVSDLLSIAQDTTQEAFREPDPLPEKIQQLLDAAEAASDEGIEMATTILKKFAK